ncbi:MAG: hypothetical protein V3T23_13470 [Nitrososphaerales archaeon]
MTKWTEALDQTLLDLSGTGPVTFKTDFLVPDIAKELEFISLSLFDKAPAVAEGLGVVFSIGGTGFEHVPLELPFPIGGSHLGAIGARRMTPKVNYFVHLPVNGGEKWNFLHEGIDILVDDAVAEVTLGWSTEPLGLPAIFSIMDRETAVTGTTANSLGNVELTNATKVVEGIGFVIPTGVTTGDMPIGGNFTVKSAAFEDQKEFSWGIDPMEGIEATSGQMGAPSIYRAPQDINVVPTTRSPTVKATYTPGQAVTTQLAQAVWGLRYWK